MELVDHISMRSQMTSNATDTRQPARSDTFEPPPISAASFSGKAMLALATYLGHVNIDATYWYLESTPELLGEIALDAESFMQRGRP